MMKLLVLAWMSLPLWAAPLNSAGHLERLLRDAARLDWPEATRIEVTQITTRGSVPSHATLIQLNPRPVLGAVNYQLAWSERGTQKQSLGSAVIKVYQPVLMSRSPIQSGDSFSEENTEFRESEISKYIQNGFFSRSADFSDKVAKTFIRAGMIVHPQQVEKPTEIKQGQMVDLVVENAQVLISAKMKALDNGRTGQWIRVENPTSKKVVRARVSAAGKVVLH